MRINLIIFLYLFHDSCLRHYYKNVKNNIFNSISIFDNDSFIIYNKKYGNTKNYKS